MRSKVAFGPYLPDALPKGELLTVAKNVYAAADGYRVAAGFQGVSEALPAEFRGGGSFISPSRTAYLLAGTSNGLVRLSDGDWLPLLVAQSVPGRWRFTQFGQFVVTVNGGVTHEVDLTGGTASAIDGAPTGTSVATVGNFVVIGQPNNDILRVRWSAFGDHTRWTLQEDQAGDQPMLTGGEVMGLAGGEYGVILQRQALRRMSLTGDPTTPFQFDEITPNFGCASKASICQAGNTVFFLSDRGFMALDDGQALRTIGNEKFDRTFKQTLGQDDFERLWAAVDPERTEVIWGIPGTPGRLWIYNWVLDRATVLEIPFDGVFPGFENSVTLDELGALYPDLDAMPFSLDDPRFSGGAPRLYVVQDGKIGNLTGDNLIAELTTGQIAPAGEMKTNVRAVWPDTDATSGVTVSINQRQRKGDADDFRTGSNMQTSGRIPLRANGRWLTITAKVANTDWTYIDGVEIEAAAGGKR